MKTQNTVGIVAALSILIAAVLIASSTITFQNAHAVTATATATASTTSGASASAIAGPCSAFASILGAIAGC